MLNTKLVTSWIVCMFLFGCGEKKVIDPKLLSCQSFVQGFYDWYVPIALNGRGVLASTIAVKEKGNLFSPELKALLEAESKIHARQNDLIQGLDFDPFLYSQDPLPEYKAGKPHVSGDVCSVPVSGVSNGKIVKNNYLDVSLEYRNNRWFFVNFYYKDTHQRQEESLLDLLARIVEGADRNR